MLGMIRVETHQGAGLRQSKKALLAFARHLPGLRNKRKHDDGP
jgi:hypothetical protein